MKRRARVEEEDGDICNMYIYQYFKKLVEIVNSRKAKVTWGGMRARAELSQLDTNSSIQTCTEKLHRY